MEQNQLKKRIFNELDWYDPTTWFGQPSVAPPAFNGISQDEKSAALPGWKTSTDNSFNSSLKSNFVKPFTKVETTVVNDVKKVENTIENIAQTAEKDLKYIGTEIYDGGKFVVKEIEIVGEDIAIAGRGLYRFGSKTVQFVENYYPLILFVGGSYLGARYINELKQAVA